jgi:hypothetical protein
VTGTVKFLVVDHRSAVKYLLVFSFLTAVIVASPPGYLLGFMEDDGFFYAVISNNVAHGFGSTFDRISLTNGYHPLWMLILSGYLWLLRPFVDTLQADPEITLKLLMIFQTALYLISLRLCIDVINKLVPDVSLAALAALVMAYAFALKQAFLMETGISLLLMLVILRVLLGSTAHREFKLSLLFGLWILARLDQVISVALIGVFVAHSQARHPKEFLKALTKLGAFPVLVTITYLASNCLIFGQLYTTSSLVKSRPVSASLGAIWHSLASPIHTQNPRAAILFLSVAATLPLIVIIARRYRGRAFDALVVAFGAQLVSLLAASVLLWEVRAWYLVLPAILGYMIWTAPINEVLTRFRPRVSRVLEAGALLAVILLASGYIYITTTYAATEGRLWAFHKKVAMETSEDAVIYCIDASGKAAFVSNRRIINGDGLVNSFDYIQQARDGLLDDYFSRAKPGYYLETRSLVDQPLAFSGYALHADFLGVNHFAFAASDLVLWDDRILADRVFALYRFDPSVHYHSGRIGP